MKILLELDEHSYPLLIEALTLSPEDKVLVMSENFDSVSEYGKKIIRATIAINLFPPEGIQDPR